MNYLELKAKYPDIHHEPRQGCKFCHGTGEKTTHLSGGEFIAEQDITSPCICTFVDHDMVDIASNMLNETISNLKGTDCLDEWNKQKVEEE